MLVRESLRALEALGLIEVKPGIGAFVAQQSPINMQIASYLVVTRQVLEVVEVRAALASLAGELAARRLSAAELESWRASSPSNGQPLQPAGWPSYRR